MYVRDKRVKHEPNVFFDDLPIGHVYENKEGTLCIKTNDSINEDNCIYLVDEEWVSNFEPSSARVIPLNATLEIEG